MQRPLEALRRARSASLALLLGVVLSATLPAPVSSSTSAVLWSAGHESGLAEWEQDGGGGLFSSGSYEAVASGDTARSGSRSLRARIWTPDTSGVRAFRWKEPRENRELYYSAWVHLPAGQRVTANFLNLFQFKSRSTDGRNDPIWGVYGVDDGRGGIRLQAGWGWGGTPVAGPRAGDGVGGRWIQSPADATLPTGRWVHLQAFLRQSKDFDGRLQFWMDGRQLFDLQDVRTSFANCSYNAWCASNEWSVNLYSDGMSPAPSTMYIDDAAIATGAVGSTSPPQAVPATEPPASTVPAPTSRAIDPACAERSGAGFDDVPATNAHQRAVGCVVDWGVANGVAPGVYRPAARVTRGQMASFVARLVEQSGGSLPQGAPDAFPDDDGTTHEANIDKLAAAGIVAGPGDGTYDPARSVSRAQMATYIVRALEHHLGRPVNDGEPTPDYFAGERAGPHDQNIDAVAAIGVTGGTDGTHFRPGEPVRRDQMASFLARSLAALVEGQ